MLARNFSICSVSATGRIGHQATMTSPSWMGKKVPALSVGLTSETHEILFGAFGREQVVSIRARILNREMESMSAMLG